MLWKKFRKEWTHYLQKMYKNMVLHIKHWIIWMSKNVNSRTCTGYNQVLFLEFTWIFIVHSISLIIQKIGWSWSFLDNIYVFWIKLWNIKKMLWKQKLKYYLKLTVNLVDHPPTWISCVYILHHKLTKKNSVTEHYHRLIDWY